MIKPNIPFERFLNIFVPGFVFLFGIWYLNRPFLMTYFPHMASDLTVGPQGSLSSETRVLVFIIASICVGMFINHISDIPIMALVDNAETSERDRKWQRRMIRMSFRIFTLVHDKDPRRFALERYLFSPRKAKFLKMIETWAGSSESLIKDPTEAVYVHQHLILRMLTLSDSSRVLVDEKYSQITFASSLFLAISLLFPFSIVALFTSYGVKNIVPIHPLPVFLSFVGITYLIGLALCFSLRRRYCHFCLQMISLALHFYELDQRGRK
jgi:hypothetical protein